jgi:lantibiotic modifying enzyme
VPSPVTTSAEPASAPTPAHRSRATEIVADIASRLTSPGHVADIAAAPGNLLCYPGGDTPVWHPLRLSDGHPGVSLLFTELAAEQRELRGTAHAHLAAAVSSGIGLLPQTLFGGMAAIAFAAHCAAVCDGGYQMLATLDRHIADHAAHNARINRARVTAGAPIGAWNRYDVLTGAAGIGRYLLARYASGENDSVEPALTGVLDMLVAVALADDIVRDGLPVPTWWVDQELDQGMPPHVNLGLAHGVCGPLALLALAWQAGLRVERHDEAIAKIVALLNNWRFRDDIGPHWPQMVTLDLLRNQHMCPARYRDSWCYGGIGASRALHLAALALDRADWRGDAHAMLDSAIAHCDDNSIKDYALCHGWSGVLHVVLRIAHDENDPAYFALADRLAGRVLAGFDPSASFGFRYQHALAPRELDRPGLLEGAAGIALVLHSYAAGQPPRTPWDAALLLA